jgi:hypothetical protein
VSLQARRLLAILAAGSVLCAQLATDVHLALVPHAICAQHGEVVEADARVGAVRAPDELDGVETHFDMASPPTSASEHEHCLASVLARHRSLISARLAVAGPASHEARAPRSTARAPYSPVEALRLAPKQSPPMA